MYRPENWKNPYKDHWGKQMTLREDYETNQHYSFEAGADAMLEALRNGGHYAIDWDTEWFKRYGIKIKPTHKSYATGSFKLAEGWLIFIPREENEKNAD